MGFFDFFKRKKEITPDEMSAMMENLRKGFEFVGQINDVETLLPQAKSLYAEILKVEPVVDSTLTMVEKNIKDLSGRNWWATAEAVGRDLAGLRRGKSTLLSYKQEIETMKSCLEIVAAEKQFALVDKEPENNGPQGPSNN